VSQKEGSSALLPVSVLFGALVVVGAAFRDYVIDIVGPFVILLLLPVAAIAALGLIVAAAASAIREAGARWQTAAAGIITILATAAVLALPLEWIGRRVDLTLGASARMEIVRMVADGRLGGAEPVSVVPLPVGFENLSADGTIGIQRSQTGYTVLFVRSRGVLDVWSGIAYSSGRTPSEEDPYGSQILRVDSMGDDWFWVWAH